MKLNKKILKSIVKECLVEILAEGLISGNDRPSEKRAALHEDIRSSRSIGKRPVQQSANRYKNQQTQNENSRGSYLDQVSYGSQEEQRSQTKTNNHTERLVSRVTSDPLMSEILADTAKSTLVEQREGSTRTAMPAKPADEAARIVAATDPTDLFGDSAGKWADLAFAPKLNR
jgi:hypothetical protein